jgi:hypothetical protein
MPLAVEKPTPECSHSRHTIQLANCVPTSIDRFKFQEVVQDGKPFEIHVHVVNDAHTNTSSRSEKNFAKRNHKYLIYVSTSVHLSSRKYAKFPVYQIGIVEKGHRVIQKSCQKVVRVIGITLGTTAFDCKCYEEYLRLLLEMVRMTKVEGKLIGVMELSGIVLETVGPQSNRNAFTNQTTNGTRLFFDLPYIHQRSKTLAVNWKKKVSWAGIG